jgi:hypothetical protein
MELVLIEPGVRKHFKKGTSYYHYDKGWTMELDPLSMRGENVCDIHIDSLKYLENLITNDKYVYTFIYYNNGNEEFGYEGCLIRQLKGE